MRKYKTFMIYKESGDGFIAWAPFSDVAEFWFSTKSEVFSFAASLNWQVKHS